MSLTSDLVKTYRAAYSQATNLGERIGVPPAVLKRATETLERARRAMSVAPALERLRHSSLEYPDRYLETYVCELEGVGLLDLALEALDLEITRVQARGSAENSRKAERVRFLAEKHNELLEAKQRALTAELEGGPLG